jgi:hypothetical protein
MAEGAPKFAQPACVGDGASQRDRQEREREDDPRDEPMGRDSKLARVIVLHRGTCIARVAST